MEENVGLSSLGGSCWFGVELKTFEILLEIVKGKEVGKIVERGRGFSSWIRFGERSLVGLLEGVEDCYNGKFGDSFRRAWKEGGRVYKLELCNNKVGGFLLCLALNVEEKRFSLVFLEGREFLRGLEDPCIQSLGASRLLLSQGL